MSVDNEFVFQSNDLPINSFPFFEEMKRKRKLCDITFQVGGHSVSAHRIILVASIPYFRHVFCTDETSELTENEMQIPEIDPCTFEALIDFAYSCKITITMENVKNLLLASCSLDLKEVQEACCKFLEDRLDFQIALDTRQLALSLGCSSLLQKIDYHIRKDFDSASQSKSFVNLSCTDLKELICRNDLHVSSEEKVFEAVMNWVQGSPSDRAEELPELLKNVRMTLLQPRYLFDCVAKHVLVRSSIPCRDLLDEVKSYHLFHENGQTSTTFITEPRLFLDDEKICSASPIISKDTDPHETLEGATSIKNDLRVCKVINQTTWTIDSSDSERCVGEVKIFDDCSAVEVNGKIYVFHEDLTLEYDFSTDCCKIFEGSGKRFAGAVSHHNTIYICGGKIGSRITNTIKRFDSDSKRWSTNIPNMRSRRLFPAVVLFKGCFYVIGGFCGPNIYRSVERYEIQTGEWTLRVPMLTRRYAAGSAVLNGTIYVCGGKSYKKCLDTAEVYSPRKKTWRFISPMNKERCKFTLLAYNGNLYAIGGEDFEGNAVNSMEVYYPNTNKWDYIDADTETSRYIVLLPPSLDLKHE